MSHKDEEMVTAYMTKYALTQGIVIVRGQLRDGGKRLSHRGRLYFKNEFALTLEEANEQALTQIERREKSLKASLAKLQKLRTAIPLKDETKRRDGGW